MNFLNRFRIYCYLLVLLSMVGFCYADKNIPLLFLSLLGLFLSWVLVELPRGRPLPRWCINVGVLLSSIALFYELVVRDEQKSLLLALGHFMDYLLICKLFDHKNNRDYAQILILSLLLMVTGTIFSSSLFFGLLLALFLAIGLYTILLFHLKNETEHAVAHHLPGAPAPPEKHLRRDIRLVTWGCGLAMILFATFVFILLPRDRGRNMLGVLGRTNLLTGFSETTEFRDYSKLQQSNAVVMQVRLEQNGLNAGSESEQPYFRAMTLNAYDVTEGRWLRFGGPPVACPVDRNGRVLIAEPNLFYEGLMTRQIYTLTNPSTSFLFAMSEVSSVKCPQVNAIMRNESDGALFLPGNVPSELQYEVDSYFRFRPEFVSDTPPMRRGRWGGAYIFYGDPHPEGPGGRRRPFPLPEIIVNKAHELGDPLLPKDGSAPSAQQIRAVANRMIEELYGYAYSLETYRVDPNLDPTADFLKNRKTIGGHCEYFASAMVLMCTAVNIPARMVTGYHGGDYNNVGGFYTVRQRNAHAWVEIFLPGEGWITFDPTPANSEIPMETEAGLVRWIRELFQTIEHHWLSGIITFDNSTRRYLIDTFITPLERIPLAIGHTLRYGWAGFCDLLLSRSVGFWRKLLLMVSLGLLVAGCAWLLFRWHRRRSSVVRAILRRVDPATRRKLIPDLLFLDDLLRRIARLGGRRPEYQTPAEYVELTLAHRPEARAHARWLVQMFYEIRFGSAPVTDTVRQKIRDRLRRLRDNLTQPNP